MAETQSAYARANGIRIHYRRTGGEKPPLVLAHGFYDNGACWASLTRVLWRDWDVIAYDARGHGLSDAPESGYGSEEQSADLLGLIEALGLERPVLMGHSMGGNSVAWAAVARPELPRALILEDSGIHTRANRERLASVGGGRAMPDWAESLRKRSRDQLVEICRRQSPNWPEEDLLPWAESKLQLSPNVAGLFSGMRRDLAESYATIRCPVLFLKAEAPEDVRAEQREIVKSVPRASLFHVEGAGHNVRRDTHPETVDILVRFLAGV